MEDVLREPGPVRRDLGLGVRRTQCCVDFGLTAIVPPCALTRRRVMYRPRPRPCFGLAGAEETIEEMWQGLGGDNHRRRYDRERGAPTMSTATSTSAPASEYLVAFENRLSKSARPVRIGHDRERRPGVPPRYVVGRQPTRALTTPSATLRMETPAASRRKRHANHPGVVTCGLNSARINARKSTPRSDRTTRLLRIDIEWREAGHEHAEGCLGSCAYLLRSGNTDGRCIKGSNRPGCHRCRVPTVPRHTGRLPG